MAEDAIAPLAVVEKNSSVFDRVYENLNENPYFKAGAGLAGIGLAASVFRRFAIIGNTFFRRRFMISLQINNEDASYPWLLDFINRRSVNQTRNLSVNTVVQQAESGKTALSISYLPGHGTHFFVHNYRWIKIERQREKQVIQRDGIRTPFETVTLTTLGSDVGFFKQMLSDSAREAIENTETGLVIYQAIGPQWVRFGVPRKKRDIETFASSSKWYADRGVPYRRGYLFYGPPGTGKSSFISALASHFGYSVCMLSLSERTLDDDRLNHLLNTAPPNSILILEDIDAAFVSREDPLAQHPAYQGMSRVTFSGLLNALDGVACAEERVTFMTTNYVDRLDPALIRPGRVDRKQFFGYATPDMLRKMFKRFYISQSEDLCEEFVKKALALNADLSPAAIQGHFLFYKDNPKLAIENVGDMARKTS
ncbi:unnamed protein product [Caenorhabditis auriculariae]|uniref:Mitochondrial chaperone BCS1 n=1 Tax=Caenorhabditis auriculariae TaxID=2777116 RepID=A0A8S1HXY3_9PELO|nr:unnamed protein product [Caenorhabditis auriculariae]